MTKIYVVEGSTGEYSDHDEWMVKAFTAESVAREFVEKCTEEANRVQSEIQIKTGRWYVSVTDFEEYNIAKNKYDPDMRVDYTGVNYNISCVELCDKI